MSNSFSTLRRVLLLPFTLSKNLPAIELLSWMEKRNSRCAKNLNREESKRTMSRHFQATFTTEEKEEPGEMSDSKRLRADQPFGLLCHQFVEHVEEARHIAFEFFLTEAPNISNQSEAE